MKGMLASRGLKDVPFYVISYEIHLFKILVRPIANLAA